MRENGGYNPAKALDSRVSWLTDDPEGVGGYRCGSRVAEFGGGWTRYVLSGPCAC
jgi:hypothetical protein